MSWGSEYDKKIEEYEELVAAGYSPRIMGSAPKLGACHLRNQGGHLVGGHVTEEWCKKHGGTWTSGQGFFPLLWFPTSIRPIPVPPPVPTPPPPGPPPGPPPAPGPAPAPGPSPSPGP